MIKIPEDVQQKMIDAQKAAQKQQEYRDRMLSMILAQLDELNRHVFDLAQDVSDIADFLDGIDIECFKADEADDDADDNAE